MDKIQEAVNEQVNELLKQHVAEAFQKLDITAVVNKYLQTRLDNPNFQQFVGKQVLEIDNLNLNGRVIGTSDTVLGDDAKRGGYQTKHTAC